MLAVLFSGEKAWELRLASFLVKMELQGKSPVVLRETPFLFLESLTCLQLTHLRAHLHILSNSDSHSLLSFLLTNRLLCPREKPESFLWLLPLLTTHPHPHTQRVTTNLHLYSPNNLSNQVSPSVLPSLFNEIFPGGSDGKETTCSAGDPGSIPGSGRSVGEGNGLPLQYSCLKNSKDRGV